MPKYNDFDLDLNVEQADLEGTINAIRIRTEGPYKSCYYICPASEVGECY